MKILFTAAALLLPGGLIIGGLLWYLTKDMDIFKQGDQDNDEVERERRKETQDQTKTDRVRSIDQTG